MCVDNLQGPSPGQQNPYQNQGAIGYNPNWNTAGAGYQAWPNQPQAADAGLYFCQLGIGFFGFLY